VTERDLMAALVEEFGAVAAAMLGGEPRLEPNEEGLSPVLCLPFSVTGSLAGRVTVAVAAEDASKLAALVLGFDEPPADDIITDSLQEMAQQMASSITVKEGPAIKVTVSGPVEPASSAAGGSGWYQLTLGDLQTRIAAWHELTVQMKAAPVAAPTPAPPIPQSGPPTSRPAVAASSQAPNNLELILDIELPLWVRFGETAMSLQALTKLGPGSTLDLERSPDDPVDVMVNNTVIARGEVVVVAGNYGVRVTEVVSTTDRIRSMAG
jgi:flagellar motor switch protein FliN